MTEWHIQLFGGFDVRRDSVSLSGAFQTDSARLLFAWLCLHQRQAVRRETLANLLWPDRPQNAAQNTLRVTLSRIRQALGNDQHVLRTETATVTLDLPGSWQVDALDFAQAVTAVRNHSHRSAAGCPSCQAHLHLAAALYRGHFWPASPQKANRFSNGQTIRVKPCTGPRSRLLVSLPSGRCAQEIGRQRKAMPANSCTSNHGTKRLTAN